MKFFARAASQQRQHGARRQLEAAAARAPSRFRRLEGSISLSLRAGPGAVHAPAVGQAAWGHQPLEMRHALLRRGCSQQARRGTAAGKPMMARPPELALRPRAAVWLQPAGRGRAASSAAGGRAGGRDVAIVVAAFAGGGLVGAQLCFGITQYMQRTAAADPAPAPAAAGSTEKDGEEAAGGLGRSILPPASAAVSRRRRRRRPETPRAGRPQL